MGYLRYLIYINKYNKYSNTYNVNHKSQYTHSMVLRGAVG